MEAIDLKEAAQFSPVVGTAEAIGPQHTIAARNERPDLVGEQLHVVRRRDHGTAGLVETGLDMRALGRRGRMPHVPAIDVETVTAQLHDCLLYTSDAAD